MYRRPSASPSAPPHLDRTASASSSDSTTRSRSSVAGSYFSSGSVSATQTSLPLTAVTSATSALPSPKASPRGAHVNLNLDLAMGPGKPGWDEMDRMGYLYSLRVAVLHHHLLNPPSITARSPTPSSIASPTLNSPGASPRVGLSPLQPQKSLSPSLDGSSSPKDPKDSRKSFGFLSRSSKSDAETVKLPKEFLAEFWGTLANENGDAGWNSSVKIFLGQIKKGTKTPSGLNLREVGTLLEAFTTTLPVQSPTSAAPHVHQSHLMQLLYNSLPRSSHFSPLARPQSEKDRDLLFRLRAEVQSYMLHADPTQPLSPNPNGSASTLKPALPIPTGHPSVNGRTGSPVSLAVGARNPAQEVKRKPSPIWVNPEDMLGEMAETVGEVWGVPKDMVEKDVENIKNNGPLERLYLKDLKQILSAGSSVPNGNSAVQRQRQEALSQTLQCLLRDFPELAMPGSPLEYDPSSLSGDSSGLALAAFFTPPRKVEVYARLTSRVSESAGLGSKSRDLVERCRDVWGVTTRREREKEMENVVSAWFASVGTADEAMWGKTLADGVRDLSYGMRVGDPLPSVMEELLAKLLDQLAAATTSIFPTTAVPPPSPPVSLLPLINAAGDLFTSHPMLLKRADDLADELKGAAVGEYVAAVGHIMGGVGQELGGGQSRYGDSGKDAMVEGFEKVAKWMEKEVRNVRKVWGNGLGSVLNPAAIILSKQLPLFLAELHTLDKPRGPASDVFTLYETTGRLLETWEDLCPTNEHGFELDAFFEPHVLAWLRDTELNNSTEWVSRAVGMDSWVPEGENKHSQSVIDLFEFVRESAQVILHDLPLSEYKRAVYLIDLSKTVSFAVRQYASTVEALFVHDMNPPKASTPTLELSNKLNERIGGKASSWLAKGQQAVKSLERKKVDGFSVPPAACVKLTDMGASKVCVDDLLFALEAEDTTRIIKAHKLNTNAPPERTTRHVFTVTVARGENLLGKSQSKGADGFVVITDKENGGRLIKTRTVLGAEDPKWEQSFEISVGAIKTLELVAYDRQLVGKHEPIGIATFNLNPKAFGECATRDIVLPLSPRGMVHLRISMDGGERHDIAYHLSTATRALDRVENDMCREIVDRMSEFMRAQLSAQTINGMTKVLKDKKKPRAGLTEGEIEGSLMPLFEYLNENFSVFSVTLTPTTRLVLMSAIWRRIIDILISLLVPPLSDKPCTSSQLGPLEIDVVFKWLQLLKSFFNASENGVEHGIPLMDLQKGGYKDIIMLGQYLDLPTPALKERAAAAVKSASRPGAAGPIAGAMARVSIGPGGGMESGEERMAEILLRIARTRSDTAEFLQTQIASLTRARIERQAGVM